MKERSRSQLVVGLGEGEDGERLRKAFDRAAAKAGLPVTVWAREKLVSALDEAERTALGLVEVRRFVRRTA